jgi:dihydrofolate reductase
MEIALVAAMSRGRVIGSHGRLPWPRIPEDLKLFRRVTLGKVVLMGRKTFEDICASYGKPLDGRISIVLSRHRQLLPETCRSVSSKKEALEVAQELGSGTREIMVIGGASIFKQFIDDAQRLHLTFIDHQFPGDTFFPKINHRKWYPKWISSFDQATLPLKYVVFERR